MFESRYLLQKTPSYGGVFVCADPEKFPKQLRMSRLGFTCRYSMRYLDFIQNQLYNSNAYECKQC